MLGVLPRFAALVTIVLVAQGCMASRRIGEPRPLAPGSWPVAATEIRSVSIDFESVWIAFGRPRQVSQEAADVHFAPILKAYTDSGLFSEVFAGEEPGVDLIVTVRFTNSARETSVVRSILAGLTGFWFPYKVAKDFRLETTVKDETGVALGEANQEDGIVTTAQVLLVFTPQSRNKATFDEMAYDLARDSILDLHRQGVW